MKLNALITNFVLRNSDRNKNKKNIFYLKKFKNIKLHILIRKNNFEKIIKYYFLNFFKNYFKNSFPNI